METVTVYAVANPVSPSTADLTGETTTGGPQQSPASSPAAPAPDSASASSSSQSNNIALWVPVSIVILLIIVALLSWATKSQRKEMHWRADEDPHAPIAVRRNRTTNTRTLASMRDLQRQPNIVNANTGRLSEEP